MQKTKITLYPPSGPITQHETDSWAFRDDGSLFFKDLRTGKALYTSLPYLLETNS